jgi:hypothetical protein
MLDLKKQDYGKGACQGFLANWRYVPKADLGTSIPELVLWADNVRSFFL